MVTQPLIFIGFATTFVGNEHIVGYALVEATVSDLLTHVGHADQEPVVIHKPETLWGDLNYNGMINIVDAQIAYDSRTDSRHLPVYLCDNYRIVVRIDYTNTGINASKFLDAYKLTVEQGGTPLRFYDEDASYRPLRDDLVNPGATRTFTAYINQFNANGGPITVIATPKSNTIPGGAITFTLSM